MLTHPTIIQGWEFTQLISKQIARFLPKNERMSDSLKKMSDSLIRSFWWATWAIRRAGNLLIRSSFICSFAHFAQIKWATVSHLLRSLKTNEQSWANRSGRSEEMSDREWMFRSLRGNERMSDLLKKFWLKKSKILFFSMFYIQFFIEKMSESLISSFLVSDVSESLISLTKNERPWAICSGRSEEMSEWAICSKNVG